MRIMENTHYELDKPLLLKEETRKKLQKIYGKLISEDELKNIEGEIFSVGDVVTHTLLNRGIKPKIAIVDYKTKRGEKIYEDVKKFGKKIIKVKNPRSQITPELWNAVREAMQYDSVKIEVDGEEDLAVIPVVFFANLGANVIYGMPNTGLVWLKVSDEDKRKVMEIIKEMEV
ncbi:conserved hypothetical protein [Aciduliprofundum boonei T469]|nr:conserved hypothetical protein [Aciduliprofundum boonei T469]